MDKKTAQATYRDLTAMYGAEPPIEVVANRFHMSVEDTKAVLAGLTSRPSPAKRPKRRRRPAPVKAPRRDIPTLIVRVAMGVVGVGTSGLSCRYTAIWFAETLSVPLAVLFSALMVLFALAAVQTIVLLARTYRWWASPLIAVLALLWAATTGFSMSSTVIGQYNTRMHSAAEAIEAGAEEGAQVALYESLKTEERELTEALASAVSDREQIQQMLAVFDYERRKSEGRYYEDLQWRLSVANRAVAEREERLQALRERLRSALTSGVVSTTQRTREIRDFYLWAAGLFGVSRDALQFAVSVFPAVFIDIMAPLGISIAFFLRPRRKTSKSSS